MAKVHQEVLIIKLSKLVKKTEEVDGLASEEIVSALEQVTQELVGESVIVEVEKE